METQWPFFTWNLQWPDLCMCHWSSTAGGSERRKGNADWEQQFLKLLWCCDQPKEFNNPTEQRSYKNTFGHLTNFHCVELFQICFLSFVRLRLRDQFSPVDMEKSVAFTPISQTLITHCDRHAEKHERIRLTHTRTDISHVITIKTTAAAAVRLKGGHQFDTI